MERKSITYETLSDTETCLHSQEKGFTQSTDAKPELKKPVKTDKDT